ncbi:MFS transporter [Microbulbifer sp.]|uniref:MFS transporter n=1 Tax=Microbulbifer sp. TaxID=1908541 RepID=UPI003F31CE07
MNMIRQAPRVRQWMAREKVKRENWLETYREVQYAEGADRPTGIGTRLAPQTLAGYGVGDAGLNLLWSSTSFYLLFFYTDVLGVNAATAGLIILVAMIWDAVTDPVMGYYAEKTRSRWGSYRPYLLFGSLPLGASFLAMFAAPVFAGQASAGALLLTHMLFRSFYTIVSVPYSALSARLTADSLQRGRVSAARMIFATLGALVVARYTLEIADTLGGGDRRTGFVGVAAIYGGLAALMCLITFLSATEARQQVAVSPPNPRQAATAFRNNWPFALLLLAVLAYTTATNIFLKGAVYYLNYTAEAASAAIGQSLAAYVIAATISIPLWSFSAELLNKRFVWIGASGLQLAVLIAFYQLQPASTAAVTAIMAVYGIGAGGFVLSIWSMLPDTVEFGQYKSGLRAESLLFGLMALTQKIALGIGIGGLGLLLQWAGYQANSAENGATLDEIRLIMTAMPALLTLAAGVVMVFYPIDRAFHSKLCAGIESRSQIPDNQKVTAR